MKTVAEQQRTSRRDMQPQPDSALGREVESRRSLRHLPVGADDADRSLGEWLPAPLRLDVPAQQQWRDPDAECRSGLEDTNSGTASTASWRRPANGRRPRTGVRNMPHESDVVSNHRSPFELNSLTADPAPERTLHSVFHWCGSGSSLHATVGMLVSKHTARRKDHVSRTE